jgi:hypothetical protein
MFDTDSITDAGSVAQLPNGHSKNRAHDNESLMMMVENIFRTIGLSGFGTRKQRILFAAWSLWLLVRAVFMIAIFITQQRSNESRLSVCDKRSTILSMNGYLNRPLQTAIYMFDFFGWMLIFFSSLGSRSPARRSLSAPNPQSAHPLRSVQSVCCCSVAFFLSLFCSNIPYLLFFPQLALLPPSVQQFLFHAASLQL